jgi:uncharacterized protein (DUF1778 family)
MKKPVPNRPKRTHVLGVRVDDDLKAAIEAAAAAEERSVSQWLAMLARAALLTGKRKPKT